MNKETGEIVQAMGLRNDEALRRGLVRIPDEDLDRVMAMTQDERLAYVATLAVRTELAGGAELVQPVAPLLKRWLEARAARNKAKRERRKRRGK